MKQHHDLDDIGSTGDKPCAQPICRHSRDDHGDGSGIDTHCQLCVCSAYVSRGRMIGRRLLGAFFRGGDMSGPGIPPPAP